MTNNFILSLILLCSCSDTAIKNVRNKQNRDTTYSTTTQQLKNNHIPDSVFQMTNLKHLSIMGMDCDYGDHTHCWDIAEIPSQIKNLKNLTTLSLNGNAIQTIPIELAQLKNLKTLDLSDNVALSSVDNIERVTSLEYLSLYGCILTKLPDRIGDLKNLKQLGLVGNKIDKQEQTRIKKALPNCIISF